MRISTNSVGRSGASRQLTSRRMFTSLRPEKERTSAAAPQAAVCIDPFHVVALANRALDEVRRSEWNRARGAGLDARAVKYTRWALLKRPDRLSEQQRATL